jgi:hypothetical protein
MAESVGKRCAQKFGALVQNVLLWWFKKVEALSLRQKERERMYGSCFYRDCHGRHEVSCK